MKKLVRAAVAAAVLSAGAVSPAFAALVNGAAGDSDASLTVFDSLNQRVLRERGEHGGSVAEKLVPQGLVHPLFRGTIARCAR